MRGKEFLKLFNVVSLYCIFIPLSENIFHFWYNGFSLLEITFAIIEILFFVAAVKNSKQTQETEKLKPLFVSLLLYSILVVMTLDFLYFMLIISILSFLVINIKKLS